MNRRLVLTLMWMATLLLVRLPAQNATPSPAPAPSPTSTVEIVAFSTNGVLLHRPVVEVFQLGDGRNLASKFDAGLAEGIPYGMYRIQVYVTGFATESRNVRVDQPRTTVVMGFPLGGIDFSTYFRVGGHVVGQLPPPGKKTFVKLTGIYSDVMAESLMESDGGFHLGEVPWGNYILLVVDEDGILASRAIEVPYQGMAYKGPPLEIKIGSQIGSK